jgi:hypothetical protein
VSSQTASVNLNELADNAYDGFTCPVYGKGKVKFSSLQALEALRVVRG